MDQPFSPADRIGVDATADCKRPSFGPTNSGPVPAAHSAGCISRVASDALSRLSNDLLIACQVLSALAGAHMVPEHEDMLPADTLNALVDQINERAGHIEGVLCTIREMV